MAASQRSLRLNNVYRFELLAARDRAVIAVASSWRALTIESYDEQFPAWLRSATATVAIAQGHAATLSNRFAAAYVGSELNRSFELNRSSQRRDAGRTVDGRPVSQVLALSDISTRSALARGASPERGLDLGLARAVRATRTEVMDAGRSALAEAMVAEPRIVGWQRITTGAPCGACLALSDQGLRTTEEDLEIHPSCTCTALPVVGGVRDTVQPLTGMALFESKTPAEQDALFDGGAGAVKAQLLRGGDITLADLVTHHHHPEWTDGVYETPLNQLPAAATN
jgi:hypothetical protein